MYSAEWFDTFVARRAPAADGDELEAITAHIPRPAYSRVIDIGCGTGRIAGPLATRGYAVTGIDINPRALRIAQDRAPGPWYVALDQRDVGSMRWHFDAVLVLWNSLGFVDRTADLETVVGLTAILSRGGKVLFDMYHPDWVRDHELPGEPDPDHGAAVRRWVRQRRCFHEIRYPSGQCDDIQFELYQPDELSELVRTAGLVPGRAMTWWDMSRSPSRQIGRYQIVCTRSS